MFQIARQRQARSVATRERLIAATLDEIFEVGLCAATTHQIAQRAEVSRGALLHHFPARDDIILAAMETLLEDSTARLEAVTERVRQGKVPLDELVELLWQTFSGRSFYLALEMITEARNDHDLRARLIPIVKIFHDALDAISVELCNADKRSARQSKIILHLTLNLMRGMGFQTVLRPDPDYYRDLLEAWKAILPHLIDGPAGDAVFAGERFRP